MRPYSYNSEIFNFNQFSLLYFQPWWVPVVKPKKRYSDYGEINLN